MQDVVGGSPEVAQRRKKPVKLDSLKKEIDSALLDLESTHHHYRTDQPLPSPPDPSRSMEAQHPADDPIAVLESSYEAKVHKGEYFVLKRNYESLLVVLKEQEEERMRQAAVIEDLQHEIQETKAAFEVDLETYKLENMGLRQKLRTVTEAKDWTVVCDMYETEIDKLTQQVRLGRDEVVALLQQVEKAQRRDSTELAVDEVAVLQKEQKQTVAELRGMVRKLQGQLQALEGELSELKKQERRWKLNRKGLETISRRTGDLQVHVNKQKSQLDEMQEINSELETRLLEMREKNTKLEKEVEEVTQDNRRLVDDLKTMRELAISSGLSPATVDRLHKGVTTPQPPAAKLALSLIQRLQKACGSIGDKAVSQLADNIGEEVMELVQALEATSGREQSLLHVLVDMQEKLSKQDQVAGRQSNRALRNSILATLST